MTPRTNSEPCPGPGGATRRRFLKAFSSGFLGLSVLDLLEVSLMAEGAEHPKCDAVILLWLAGGPSHIDTFDPKPDAAEGIRGTFKTIQTRAEGIQICEHLPTLAKQMKHGCLIRSMTHGLWSHNQATWRLHTGKKFKKEDPGVDPSLGARIAHLKSKTKLKAPAFVSLVRGKTNKIFASGPRDGILGPGALGAEFAPLIVSTEMLAKPEVQMGSLVQPSLNETAYLQGLQRLSPESKRAVANAFDLSPESNSLRAGYGGTLMGREMLVARRLVEKGVRFVEIILDHFEGLGNFHWDHHANIFATLSKVLPVFDRALGGLIEDLQARGKLKRTLVLALGEFGRGPQINKKGGRNHWGNVFSCFLAGGGLKSGYAYGMSDRGGAEVKENPVSPSDLHATIFHLLGVDYSKFIKQGRPIQALLA